MRMLLKTRCGCTQTTENHYREYSTPPPVWFVPLKLKGQSVYPPEDYIRYEKMENREFHYTDTIEADGRWTHIYEEK